MKNTQLTCLTRFDKGPDAGIDCSNDEKITQQHFADECDINNIIKKHTAQDIIESARLAKAIYGDFDSSEDYASILQRVKDAEQSFLLLPVHIRNRFDNDPTKLIRFVENPANIPEGMSLGIFAPKETVTQQGGQQSGTSPLDVTVLTDTRAAGQQSPNKGATHATP